MTLDEAIKILDGKAEYWESKARKKNDGTMSTMLFCKEQAKVYRQGAEWLRQLSEIRHLFNVTEKIWKHNCVGKFITLQEGYDILFSEHKQLREIFEEVANASDTM